MEEGKDTKVSTTVISKVPSTQYREYESEEERFHHALLELKDLRSQLHHAADYCETAFSKSEHKKMILEGTKSYICEAMVAVVDHLGNVSSKLEQSPLANAVVVQTEQRIDCLKQRLLTCQHYATSLELSSMQLSIKFPRQHQHYVSPAAQCIGKSSDDLSRTEGTNSQPAEVPITKDHSSVTEHFLGSQAGTHFMPASNGTISGVELAKAVPVLEGPSMLSKPRNSSFSCKSEDLYMLEGVNQKKKPVQIDNFLSFLRFNKRKI
ncbi:probable protein ABIL5 [Musa acuminata AAA Group]|uniref:probable protein ABIL5 n=1 Tax=Musa acuminata AAA Group TaxID=214697 RepID=UPI0031D26724